MYAVVECKGKQYTVSEGDAVRVDRMNIKQGESITFDRVLMVVDEGHIMAKPDELEKVKVTGTVLEEEKGEKVIVFKYKRRKGYRNKQGHRQQYTRVKVDQIQISQEIEKE
ncbi:MAG: 50S ribosomal protein L21 [bacterium]